MHTRNIYILFAKFLLTAIVLVPTVMANRVSTVIVAINHEQHIIIYSIVLKTNDTI